MQLYNTLTKTIDEFVPVDGNIIRMYTCGPTVYHYAHIGNLRSYIEEDVLEKFLRYSGYDVRRVMNITDVGHLTSDADTGDDKMVRSAEREHKTVMQVAKFYTDAFFEDCRKLNIRKPDTVVPATSMIGDFIKIISVLMDKGYAYKAGPNVYFDTSKVQNYYCLTGHDESKLQVGVRDDVEEDTNKRNKADFVLWFTKSKFEDQALKWDSPWGVGYPGWHIECTSIAIKNLGEHLDLHCGGVDNIFPHHTNEIAQSEAYLGHPWCRHWFHVQHLNDKNGKMSKSKGNVLTVSTLEEKGYDPLVYRLFCLQSHYRKPLEFDYGVMDQMANVYKKLLASVAALSDKEAVNEEQKAAWRQKFLDTMGMDLNTASSLTLLYDVLKDPSLNDSTKLAVEEDFDQVLSLDLTKTRGAGGKAQDQVDDELRAYVEARIAERKEAKKAKDFAKADAIREELSGKGIVIKDTRQGTVWEKA